MGIFDRPEDSIGVFHFSGDNIFADVHTRALANRLLELGRPDLVAELTNALQPLLKLLQAEKEALQFLKTERRALEDRIAEAKKQRRIIVGTTDRLSEFFKKYGIVLISLGLSYMQFMTLSEILGVSIQNYSPEDTLLLAVAAFGGLALTFGAKEGLTFLIKASPRFTREKDKQKPLWQYFAEGEPLAWASAGLIVIEAVMAQPGFLSMLPPRLAGQSSYQITAYLASGMCAFTNVLLSWGVGLKYLQEQKQGLHKPVHPEEEMRESVGALKMKISRCNQEIAKGEKKVRSLEKRAARVQKRWDREVKTLLRKGSHRGAVEASYIPRQEDAHSNNGHNPRIKL